MPLRLRITGESLRITGEPGPGGSVPISPPPPPPTEALLATEAGEIIVTDAAEGIVVEPINVQ
jgi:hypothetical protein